ncbi:hypothetical protein Mnod_6184 [Methylobacterium nodulans ORS 2060]|uniref:Uncharacterized protein n=1 Tax=Methylobacterium nodulans (strain LMG 21967 / CNCM I-2342 / ORS 2060) TaxID=460265 RepID=B8IVE5_METNO|nr:hypothetical protein Mnod_6184 [Methylobacterium nodulans ORS 2060]
MVRSIAGITVASVGPSSGLPGSAVTWATNRPPRQRVRRVATETVTPNSKGLWVLPMHSTSGACRR